VTVGLERSCMDERRPSWASWVVVARNLWWLGGTAYRYENEKEKETKKATTVDWEWSS
jgi:hypothetical protein